MKNAAPLKFSLTPARDATASSHSRACPRCHSAVFNVSRRLSDLFLSLFIPVFADDVPATSILREFMGGSAFDY